MAELLKLHLGCGDSPLPNPPWINIDTRMQPGVDRVDNIGILKRYQPGCAQVIYSCHNLDHFSRWEYPRVLKRWHELLAPCGELFLSVIDFQAIAKLYLSGTPLWELTGALVAAQDYDSNVRHMHWNSESLRKDLCAAGFHSVEQFTPFHDDCSTAEIHGVPISLNLRALK